MAPGPLCAHSCLWSPSCPSCLCGLPSPSKVQVLYGGTDLFDYEVRRTFNNDMLLAFISSSCIAALVYILTSCSGRVFWKTHKGQPLLFPMCSCLAKAASQEFQNSHKYTSQSQGGHCAQKSSSKPGQVNGGSEAGWAIPRAHTPEPLSWPFAFQSSFSCWWLCVGESGASDCW
jgi:hypothetical protein